jgi:hypothetical protein
MDLLVQRFVPIDLFFFSVTPYDWYNAYPYHDVHWHEFHWVIQSLDSDTMFDHQMNHEKYVSDLIQIEDQFLPVMLMLFHLLSSSSCVLLMLSMPVVLIFDNSVPKSINETSTYKRWLDKLEMELIGSKT